MKLERYIENNFSDVCVWNDIFSHDERIILQEGFLLTGLLSVMFSAWLSVTLLFTSLRFDSSYRNLANFTSVACVRRVVPALLHLPLVKCIETTMTLIWARVLESKFPSSMKDHQQFTRSVIVMTLVSLFCWTPIAMIRGSVLLSQLMHVDLMFVTSFYIMWAMWLHWIAPTFTVIALFLVDDRVRYKMFNLCAPEHEQLDNEGTKED
ncbi:uncharacterized protein LOC142987598 isoform X2 [Anticarsia gemmatalis]|uniref:uncharacterized protein LOC142987598 isoform X2 n=1 Tax=Anticarsia gemmatalis TaxID=129554 RepID=UPI003F75F818